MRDGRAAVDSFWAQLERIRVEDMLSRAARPRDDRAHGEALARAAATAAHAGLAATVTEARAAVDDWVIALFNRSTVQPGWMEANWGRPGTVEDRANLAASLGDAVTALILGRRLDEADRDELLGTWASLAP